MTIQVFRDTTLRLKNSATQLLSFRNLGGRQCHLLQGLRVPRSFYNALIFFSLYIKMGKETDVTDFFIQLPYDTNVYSMLQKLINTQLVFMNLYSFIVLKVNIYNRNKFPGGNLTTALCWVITKRVIVISYRRFGTTHRSHLQESRIKRDPTKLWTP